MQVALTAVVAVVMGAGVVVPEAVAAMVLENPEWLDALQEATSEDDPVAPEPMPSEDPPEVRNDGTEPGDWSAPEPATFAVTLGGVGSEDGDTTGRTPRSSTGTAAGTATGSRS